MTKTSTPAFKLLGSSAEITKAIVSIQKRGQSLQRDIHVAACSILAHIEAHGDITLATRLLNAVPDMARKNHLTDWLIAFGKLTWDAEAKALAYDSDKVSMLAEAQATPFWEFKKEPAYQPFDFDKLVKAVLKRAETARKKGEQLDETKIKALRDLLVSEPAE